MLTIYRRHKADCGFTSRRKRSCACPIWVQGRLNGEYLRQSLDIRNWDAAQAVVREWESGGFFKVMTVEDALDKWISDARGRKVTEHSITKLRQIKDSLLGYCGEKDLKLVSNITVEHVRELRESWPDSGATQEKKLERLKSFFSFCVDSGWLKLSPAVSLKPPKTVQRPTLPFSSSEMLKILEVCRAFPVKGIYGEGNRLRMEAMTLLLRYSGIRLGDAVTLRRDRLHSNRLFLYTQKTGTPVEIPLPPKVVKALAAVPGGAGEYFFWSGCGSVDSATKDWQRSYRRLFDLAGITKGHPHRFRDTFSVEMLLRGVDIVDVSILLGHSSVRVTEKHYAPWVKTRQDRLQQAVMKSWD